MDDKSRTKKKQEALSLQRLGEKLVTLPDSQMADIPVPEEIYEAVQCAKTVKSHGARRRQMQLIGALMRKIDPRPVEEALHRIEEGNRRRAAAYRETERWRDELMEGNTQLAEEILNTYPDADRQHLTQLIRNAVRERETSKPRRAFRSLFRYLEKIRSL